MCGIAGYVLRERVSHTRFARSLMRRIRPRGPNDEGMYLVDRGAGLGATYALEGTHPRAQTDRRARAAGEEVAPHDLALLHTRYAILDLSVGGHQPFETGDRSLVATFNGEIYNYLEIKRELEVEGIAFRTTSDTEVLVEGYRHWGDALWPRLNGFWAAALYDRQAGRLTLTRDRLGIAPLYVRETAAGLFFGSSIQALIDVEPETVHWDVERVVGFVETGMKDLDWSTLYREIHSVPAATAVHIRRRAVALPAEGGTRFWELPCQRLGTHDLSVDEAARLLRESLFDAVALRLRADVEIACELSGGLDSSSVVAAVATIRDHPITTFTIKVPGKDEEPFARTILDRHHVDYRVLENPEDTFLSDEPSFTAALEEPYHSPNIYTHFRMRQRMKANGAFVVLTGSGGDEALAGYEHHFWRRAAVELRATGLGRHADDYERARGFGRRQVLRNRLSASYWGARHWAIGGLRRLARRVGEVGPQLLEGLSAQEYERLYPTLSFHQQRLYRFRVGMLPYYLRSNDHFTMAIPIEQRFPFLDYRVVELGLQLPIPYLFRDGWNKYVLRHAMKPFLPPAILWRRQKMGFPFDHYGFLARHRSVFEPELGRLGAAGVSVDRYGGYDHLLTADPKRLWRLCSTAFWLARCSLGRTAGLETETVRASVA